MMKILYNISKIFLAAGILFVYSCSEDVTPSLYELPAGAQPTPIITSFDPPNSALAGVTEVTITGSNFNPSVDGNFVYFNGIQGKVLSVTSTQLIVVPPAIISDSVIVRVASYKSEDFSNTLIYKLEPAVSEYYPFDATVKKEFPYGIWADNQENVYVSLSGLGIKKIIPGTVTSLVVFAPKGPETFFRAITLASDNSIYAVRGGVKGVYKVSENTTPAAFVSSANGIADNVNDVEYDATRDVIWGGGSTGILYRIRLDKNVKKFNIQGTVNAIRVAGNNLFVAASENLEEIVWKVPIINADSLGTPEQYLNFSTTIDPALKIADLVMSQDGDLYIGTDQSSDPIFNVHPDKSFETLYPGLIDAPVYSFSWGYGDILYVSDIVAGENKTVLRINMQKPGAH
jgi:hypothetical protein